MVPWGCSSQRNSLNVEAVSQGEIWAWERGAQAKQQKPGTLSAPGSWAEKSSNFKTDSKPHSWRWCVLEADKGGERQGSLASKCNLAYYSTITMILGPYRYEVLPMPRLTKNVESLRSSGRWSWDDNQEEDSQALSPQWIFCPFTPCPTWWVWLKETRATTHQASTPLP